MATIEPSLREDEYTPSNSAGPFPVSFPVFVEDASDLVVTLGGVEQTGWTFTGTLESGFYGAPNTWVNGSVTLAGPVTGTLLITGRRPPRRQAQQQEGRGTPARDLNVELNILTAVQQEQFRDLSRLNLSSDRLDAALEAAEEAAATAAPIAAIAEEIAAVAGMGTQIGEVLAIQGDIAEVAQNAAVLTGTAAALSMVEDVFEGDGVTTQWELTTAPITPANIDVWIGGSIQTAADILVSGSTLTISPAVADGVRIIVKTRVYVSSNEVAAMRDQVLEVFEDVENVEKTTNKNEPGGYAGLDADGLIDPSAILGRWLRDYLTPEDYGASGNPVNTSATDITTLLTGTIWPACLAQKKKFVLKGFFDGTRKWFKIQPGTEIPDGLQWEIDGKVGLLGTSSTGHLLRWRNTPYMRGDLVLDGGNSSMTIASGHVAEHHGLVIAKRYSGEPGAGYGTDILGAVLEGLHFQNFGAVGLFTYFLRDPRSLRDISGQRLGWAGTMHHSPMNVVQYGGRWRDIFPGEPSATANAWERNCYGVCGTRWSADRSPTDTYFKGVTVESVPTWEGGDFHDAIRCGFIDSRFVGCAMGIAFESHTTMTMQDLLARNCDVLGYGTSQTVDGLTCYPTAGITVNASSPAGQTDQVTIENADVRNIGEGRPGVTGAGGIAIRQAQRVRISGATLVNPYQSGVVLIAGAASPDEILFANLEGVNVHSPVSHAGVQRGISAYGRVLGQAQACSVNGVATKAQAFHQAGSPTYVLNYGTVGDGSSQAPVNNTAHGAV